MDRELSDQVGRIETGIAGLTAAVAVNTGQLRAAIDILKEIFTRVSPEEGERQGISLDELLAQLIMLLREQGRDLRKILDILDLASPPPPRSAHTRRAPPEETAP
jgi:hypothetical protein